MLTLGRMVRWLTTAVVVVIVAGIVLHVLDANAGNALVSAVYDVAGWLVTPFKGIFSPDGENMRIIVNWGLAALVYGIVGGVISTMLLRAGLARADRAYGRRGGVAY